MDSNLVELFNDYGGILYSVTELGTKTKKNHPGQIPFFSWILYSESIARAEEPSQNFEWIEYQLSLINRVNGDISKFLKEEISKSWIPWIFVSIFGKDCSFENLTQFLSPDTSRMAFLKLMHQLILAHGKELFSHGNWGDEIQNPERYQDPFSCSIVKCGITLKKLAEGTDRENTDLYKNWMQYLRENILHQLPITSLPDFRNTELDEDFLKLVKSFWMIAQLLELPNTRDALDRIEKYYLDFNSEELLLISAWYGWIKGYRKTGNWINDKNQRRYLSSLAIRLALRENQLTSFPVGIDPIIFFSSNQGDRLSYEKPFCRVTRIDSTTNYHDSSTITKPNKFDVILGQDTFLFTFDLSHA